MSKHMQVALQRAMSMSDRGDYAGAFRTLLEALLQESDGSRDWDNSSSYLVCSSLGLGMPALADYLATHLQNSENAFDRLQQIAQLRSFGLIMAALSEAWASHDLEDSTTDQEEGR